MTDRQNLTGCRRCHRNPPWLDMLCRVCIQTQVEQRGNAARARPVSLDMHTTSCPMSRGAYPCRCGVAG